jgi:hypothetical protein
LAAATTVACVLFVQSISLLHMAVVAVLGVLAPLGVAWLGGRLTHEVETQRAGEQADGEGRAGPWFASGLLGLACVKFCVLGLLSSGFVPAVHDEWSYLFGAQTIASGRLANPTPPHPEFFDAFHLLATPKWVTRYWPGHPVALALGVLAGWPPSVVIAMCAGTAVWIYLLGRELGGESVGRIAGLLAVLAPGVDFLASGFFSQSTFLFAITGCYVCTIRCLRGARIGWAVAAGALGGWAILTRPYSAAAMGLPLALWFIGQVCVLFARVSLESNSEPAVTTGASTPDPLDTVREAPGESAFVRFAILVVAAVLPLVAALGFLAAYNLATTGSPLRTAWVEYNREFEPDNTIGISSGVGRPFAADLTARKKAKAESIAAEKRAFTWNVALRRAVADPRRLSEMVFPAVGFYGLIAFVPFGRRDRVASPYSKQLWWLMVACIACHYVAYSFFYSTWSVYGHETIPFVIVLVAVGCVEFWRQGRDSDRPGIALAVPLILLASLALDGREVGRFIDRRREETKIHRDFRKRLDGLEHTPAIVFVQFDSTRKHDYDLINNSPDLNSRVLVVLDLGDRNSKLLEAFPERHGYLYDEATARLIPWPPPRPDVPARWPDRRWPLVASSPAESSHP